LSKGTIMNMKICGMVLVLAVSVAVARGETRGWRGDGAGVFDGTSPVTNWNGTANQNILWKTPMPGISHAMPLCVGDKVFTLSDPYDMVCVSAVDGKVLWTKGNSQWDQMPADKAARGRQLLAEEQKDIVDLEAWCVKVDELTAKLHAADTNRVAWNSWTWVFRQKMAVADAPQPGDPELKARFTALAQEGAARGFCRVDTGNDLQREKHPGVKARTLELANDFAEWWESRDRGMNLVTGRTFATPVTDGSRVYVSFANNMVAAYALDGTRQWATWDHVPRTKPAPLQGKRELYFVASPILCGDTLIVAADENRIRAYDKNTGKKKWENTYPLVNRSCGTPTSLKLQHMDVVIGANGRVYRVSDGKELAADLPPCDGGCSPMARGDVVILQTEPGTKHALKGLVALRLASTSADAIKWEKLWTQTGGDPTRSAVWQDNLIYGVAMDGKAASFMVYDAVSGAVVAQPDIKPRGHNISFSIAGGYVFTKDGEGNFLVITTGREPKLIAQNALNLPRGTGNYSLPGFGGNKLFVRSTDALYCVGAR
jgi:hypothetical protein